MASLHAKIIIFFFFFFGIVGVTHADSISCMTHDILSITFQHNLASALQNLTSLSSFTRYALTTIGSGEDQVHAMFQCRGDQSSQACMHCLAKATTLLLSKCPFSHASEIQLDACHLRYDNRTFATPDFQFEGESCTNQAVNDPVSLQAILYVVEQAISLAPRYGGYAMARGSNGYVGIAQCMGYLSETECAQCLSNATHYTSPFLPCTGSSREFHLTSCYYRYENKDFLSEWKATPLDNALLSHSHEHPLPLEQELSSQQELSSPRLT